jgi:hypothetical protein
MSQQALAFAHFMMKLGFTAHHRRDVERTKRFWAAAANFISLANEARGHARCALTGKKPKVGFGYGPKPYAFPSWERTTRLQPPQLEVAE